jgi:membrane protein
MIEAIRAKWLRLAEQVSGVEIGGLRFQRSAFAGGTPSPAFVVATPSRRDRASTAASGGSNSAPSSGIPPESGEAKPVTTPKGPPDPARSQHHTDMDKVYGPLGYTKELFGRFGTDQCPAWAASLSFFSILSIAPILLCGLAVLGFIVHDPHTAALQVQSIITKIVPDPATARTLIAQMNVEKSASTLIRTRGIAGIIGVLSLFWAALQIFVNATAPMNAAFRARETRGWVKLRVVSLGLLFGSGILFVLSLALSSGVQWLSNYADRLPFVQHLGITAQALLTTLLVVVGLALTLTVNAAMFALIYRYLPSPSARASWTAVGVSGAIIAILWEAAKQAFTWYLARFANYNKLYGSLGGLVALIFWIYYSSMILLLGAEIAKLYQDARDAAATRPPA